MGWFRKRREKRARELAEMVRALIEPVKPSSDEMLSMVQIINELGKGRLEVMKAESAVELERLKIDADDRKARREEDRADREKLKVQRAAQSEKMREFRKKGGKIGNGQTRIFVGDRGDLPPAIANCEDCTAALEGRAPAHTNHMFTHHRDGHPGWLKRFYDQNGIRNAATSN